MRILGIETATILCSAAIVADGNVLCEHSADSPRVHSEKLVSIIDNCFQTAKCGLGSLDGIAVSIGPGSFTGLRIGLSVAKGLSYATGISLVAVPTLKGLARYGMSMHFAEVPNYILSLLDARRDEVYMALYSSKGSIIEELVLSSAMSVKHLTAHLPRNSKILILGDGAEKFRQYLTKADNYDNSSYIILPDVINRCSAAAIALLGENIISEHGGEDIASMEPVYVKEFYTLVRTQHQKEST